VDAIKFVSTGILKSETEHYFKLRASDAAKGERIGINGWLTKEGHIRKNWNRRYFVLEGSRLTDAVQYYQDETLSKKKGEIPLTQCSIVDTFEGKGQQQYCFEITTTKKNGNNAEKIKYYLCAENELEKNRWITAIIAAREALEHEKQFLNRYVT
jgi:hypothetical protein